MKFETLDLIIDKGICKEILVLDKKQKQEVKFNLRQNAKSFTEKSCTNHTIQLGIWLVLMQGIQNTIEALL